MCLRSSNLLKYHDVRCCPFRSQDESAHSAVGTADGHRAADTDSDSDSDDGRRSHARFRSERQSATATKTRSARDRHDIPEKLGTSSRRAVEPPTHLRRIRRSYNKQTVVVRHLSLSAVVFFSMDNITIPPHVDISIDLYSIICRCLSVVRRGPCCFWTVLTRG